MFMFGVTLGMDGSVIWCCEVGATDYGEGHFGE